MIILLYLVSAAVLFVAGVAVYHRIMLAIEQKALVPNGTLVSVDGYYMHIYAEGEKANPDSPTLVIMSGSGIASPAYDYKALYSQLSDEYRVAVVEKFGYGYSDVSRMPRDVEIMVNQNRKALSLAGESAPYILLPHSMSALEAIYWAAYFPDEISAIIGLDMAVPESYAPFDNDYSKMKLMRLATRIGLHRIPAFNPVSDRELSASEIRQHKYLSHRVLLNNDVMAETAAVNENAKKVRELGVPDIPMLLFVSSLGGEWKGRQRDFAANSDKIEVCQLDCGHNVHHYEAERIAEESKRFIDKLLED